MVTGRLSMLQQMAPRPCTCRKDSLEEQWVERGGKKRGRRGKGGEEEGGT